MTVAIEATGLLRIHPTAGGPVAALRGLDLRVRAGEIVAIVGPSGSGKSTLLRLLAGLDRPAAGRLVVFDQELSGASDATLARHRRDHVGIVEQHYRRALSPYLRVDEAIGLPLGLRGATNDERSERVAGLLEQVGLAHRGQAWRRELSGGEQQRVAFAAALASRPALLLADEPTGELDGATAAELLDIIRALVRSEGSTCVIVTHDPMVERIADRVVHLADGRAVAERAGPDGTDRRRAVDALGWLAPDLPAEPAALGRARRPSADDDAVAVDAVARRYRAADAPGAALGLAPVSARFARGGFHVVTGPSGSGKTTLLRLITGLDRPTEGRVITLGTDLATLDRDGTAAFRAARIGLVDQVRDLVPFLSALENVTLGMAIRGHHGSEAPVQALAALDRLGVAALAHRQPEGLSAGERLRVALARALAPRPELLVLDEPTAALDRAGAHAVARTLADLDDGTITIIATTHDPVLIEAGSDRLDLPAAAARPATARLDQR